MALSTLRIGAIVRNVRHGVVTEEAHAEIRRLLGRVRRAVADRSALEMDDRFETVPAHRRRGQSDHVAGVCAAEQGLDARRTHTMALVDDPVPIALEPSVEVLAPGERLHDGDVNSSGAPRLQTAAENSDVVTAEPEERRESRPPLAEKILAVHEYQRVRVARGDQGRGRHGLSESRRSDENAAVVHEHRVQCRPLIVAKPAAELEADRRAGSSLVVDDDLDVRAARRFAGGEREFARTLEAAAWQPDVLRVVPGEIDEHRGVPSRATLSPPLVPGGIGERGEPGEAANERKWQPPAIDVEPVGKGEADRRRETFGGNRHRDGCAPRGIVTILLVVGTE